MDELLTLSQACKVMGVSYSTARKMAMRGEYPFKKVGAIWKIPRSKLYKELGLEPPDKEE